MLGVQPTGDGVRTLGLTIRHLCGPSPGERDVVQALVELPQRRDREVDDLGLERRRHATAAFSQT